MAEITREDLSRRLASYPKEALSFFDSAFAVSAKLPAEAQSDVLREVIESLRRGSRRIDGSVLQPFTKMTERESEQIATAYSLIIGLLAESNINADDFISAAQGVLFSEQNSVAAQRIAEAVCRARPRIGEVVDGAQLAGEVLPSLLSLSVAVDLRIRFVEGSIKTAVPVAILHFDTDIDREEIFLQLTQADVEDVISKLTRCLKDMETASKISVRG